MVMRVLRRGQTFGTNAKYKGESV